MVVAPTATTGNLRHGKDKLHATVADLGATVIGAVFIAFNIAPTDEVTMIANGGLARTR